jgi:hypothetical protein
MKPRRLVPLTIAALSVALGTTAHPAFAAGPNLPQCLSANESAIKLRVEHKLRQARDQSLVCAAASCPGEVRDACEKRAAAIGSAIPTIVFDVKDASGSDLSGVAITMDGEVLVTHLDGTAIAVDPGEHTFSFSAPGQPSVDKHFILSEGALDRHESIVLTSAAPVAAASPTSREPSSSGLGTRKIAGLTLGGVGVAGVAIGSVFGVMTFSSWSSAGSACGSGGTSHCSRAGSAAATSDHNAAVTDGTLSTVAFIAGGVLVASGLAVFFTGGHHEGRPAVAVAPSFGPGQAGLAVGGAF